MKLALISPNKLFQYARTEPGLASPFRFVLFNAILFPLIQYVHSLFSQYLMISLVPFFNLIDRFSWFIFPVFGGYSGYVAMVFVYVVIFSFGALANAIIFQLLARLLKGVGGFLDSYKIIAYSTAVVIPAYALVLLSEWPIKEVTNVLFGSILMLIVSIASFIVWQISLFLGISILHGVSKSRAILILLSFDIILLLWRFI